MCKCFFCESVKIIHFFSVFVLLIFFFFLLTRKKGNTYSYRLLACFLFANVILLVDKIAVHYHIELFSPHLWNIGYPFVFFFSPALYLYTRSITRNETQIRRQDYFHFLPFLLSYFIMYNLLYHFNTEEKLFIIKNAKQLLNPSLLISEFACEIQFVIYAFLSYSVLAQYRSYVKQYYSAIEKINLSWLSLIIYGFVGWRLISIVYKVGLYFNFPTHNATMISINYFVVLGFLAFVCILVYKALTIPTIVFNSELNKKYQTSPLSEEDKKNYLQRIKAYMELEKPYLNANFTLNDLSKEISVPIRYVSQVLNETLNQKFYDHVNQYRIEETKRILSDSSQIDKNISEILYETGFNAKSVFNKSFKKHVGVTPREFREQCQKQAIEKN